MSSREFGIISKYILRLLSVGNNFLKEVKFTHEPFLKMVVIAGLSINDSTKLLREKVFLADIPEDTTYLINPNYLLQLFKDINGDNLSIQNLIENIGNLFNNQNPNFTSTPDKNDKSNIEFPSLISFLDNEIKENYLINPPQYFPYKAQINNFI